MKKAKKRVTRKRVAKKAKKSFRGRGPVSHLPRCAKEHSGCGNHCIRPAGHGDAHCDLKKHTW